MTTDRDRRPRRAPSATCAPWSAATTPRCARTSGRRSRRWWSTGAASLVVQRTGWGKSAVYFVATLLLRAAGRRPDGDRLAAAGADAQPDRRRRAGRHPRGHDQLHQHRGVGADPRRGRAPARSTCCWSAPSGSTTPASATRCCRGWPRPAACWWSTRRTASPTGATTSGPTTAGSARCSADLPDGIPVLATTATANARVTADVAEQLATRHGRATTLVLRGSLDRESLRLGVVRLPTPEQRLAWLADHLAEQPGSGIVYCLTVAATQEVADYLRSRGHDVAAYSGQTEPDRAARPRGATSPPAGSRRWSRPARSAWASTRPSASWSTWARRSRRSPTTSRSAAPAAAPTRPRSCCCPQHRGPRHLGLLRLPGLPARGRRCATPCEVLAEEGRPLSTAALETYVDLSRTRLETMLKVLDVDGAVRRVRGGWEATGAAVGLRRRALRAGSPRPASASSRRCSTTSTPTGAGCGSCATSSTTPTSTAERCGRCDNCGGLDLSDRRLRRRRRRGRATRLARPGRRGRAAQDVADRAGQPRPRPQGQDRRRRRAEGRAVARLTDLGHGQALRDAVPAGRRHDGPVPVPLVQAVVEVLGDWRPHGRRRSSWSSRRPGRRSTADLADGLSRYLRVPVVGRWAIVDPVGRARPGRDELRPAGGRGRPPVPARGRASRRRPGAARRRPGRHRLDPHPRRAGAPRRPARRRCFRSVLRGPRPRRTARSGADGQTLQAR